MEVWLFVGSVLLTIVTTSLFRRSARRRASAGTDRAAFLVSSAVMLTGWLFWYLAHGVSAWGPAAIIGGTFSGGLLYTAFTTGLVEDNAPPPAAVREKVLAYHLPAEKYCRPVPRLKYVIDTLVAFLGLVVTLPIWLVITFLIWFEEPAPVFFTKNSVGRGGGTFRELKFRSMKYGAECRTGPVASPTRDPRVLRIGRWLRRWHLDELPELVNVLAGTMSLVGPRPLRTVLVEKYLQEVPGFAERHAVRPGIACIAQIQKYYISPDERLRKDRAYIRLMSVGFDLKLLWLAVVTTLHGDRGDG